MKTAVITGTFDPVTTGHCDIIKRAADICGNVVVAVCENAAKNEMFSAEQRLSMLAACFEGDNRVSVEICDIMVADFVKKLENPVIVRGARSGSDFDYELMLASINKEQSRADTLILPAKSEFSHISSSYARELIRYNKPLNNCIPQPALALINQYLGRK